MMVWVRALSVVSTMFVACLYKTLLIRRIVREGNALLQVSLRLLSACEQLGVPYALENPASSFIWDMPSMRAFIQKYNVKSVTLDLSVW